MINTHRNLRPKQKRIKNLVFPTICTIRINIHIFYALNIVIINIPKKHKSVWRTRMIQSNSIRKIYRCCFSFWFRATGRGNAGCIIGYPCCTQKLEGTEIVVPGHLSLYDLCPVTAFGNSVTPFGTLTMYYSTAVPNVTVLSYLTQYPWECFHWLFKKHA